MPLFCERLCLGNIRPGKRFANPCYVSRNPPDIATRLSPLPMFSDDTQVAPLIEIFELYMLRDATLADLREPTVIATRAMLDAGLAPEMILSVLDGAVQVAADETVSAHTADHARELRENIVPWLMGECFDPIVSSGPVLPVA
jgi:hypothetical protein